MKNASKKSIVPSTVLVANDTKDATVLASSVPEAQVIVAQVGIALLDSKANLTDIVAKVNEIIEKVNGTKTSVRNRGVTSTREMTDDDARRIMLGDLKDASHKVASETLQLSYGQIYSARKGYTFKVIYKEMVTLQKASK